MIPGNLRRSFVLSVTLTELALLLFFLLLFTAVWQINKAEDEVVQLRARNTALERQLVGIDTLSKILHEDPVKAVALLRQAAENIAIAEENDELRAQIRRAEMVRDSVIQAFADFDDEKSALEEKVADLQAQNTGMAELLQQTADTHDDDFMELVRNAARNISTIREENQLRDHLQDVTDQRDSLATQLASMEERFKSSEATKDLLQSSNSNLIGQLANLQKRVSQAGLGFPPCWADSSGKPEYIYTIILEEETFSVTSAWPSHRDAEVDDVTGARELIGTGFSQQEFSQRALSVLEWSQSQDTKCRHFVRIDDSAEMSKEAFKANLLRVENYFYKYLTSGQ